MKAQTGVTLMAAMLILVVLVVGVAFIGMSPSQAQVDQQKDIITQISLAGAGVCGDDGQGYYRPAAVNPLNTTGTEYLAITERVYQVIDGEEVFYGTVVTNTSGVQARAATGTLQITCVGADGEIMNYVAYAAAVDGTTVSTRVKFSAAEDVVMETPIANHAGLLFKVYDNDNRGYLYGSADTSAGTWNATGSTFYSSTSNTTGLTIDADGSFDYILSVKTNTTAAIDTKFNDQALYMYVNIDDSSDWNELDVTLGSVLASVEFPNIKVANDGYEFAYALNTNLDSKETKIGIQGQTLASVDATDDIVVAFGTSGYYKETVGSGMKLGTNTDSSSRTTVYALQTVTLSMA